MAELVGSKISLISNSDIRYEGVLFDVNVQESSVTLKHVKVLGTEGRRTDKVVPPRSEIYDCIVFKGSDIKDLDVCTSNEAPPPQQPPPLNDPAILQASGAPPQVQVPSKGVARPVKNVGPNQAQRRPPPQAPIGANQPAVGKVPGVPGEPRQSNKAKGSKVIPTGTTSSVNNRSKPNTHNAPNHRTSHTSHTRSQTNANNSNGGERAIPGMGKHLLFRRLRGVTEESKKQLNKKIEKDFDFESMNNKFSQLNTDSGASKETDPDKGLSSKESKDATGSKEEELGYDKKSSFFDNISSDIADRIEGKKSRLTHQEEKKLNTETFGAIALSDNRGYGYHRGGHHNNNNRRRFYRYNYADGKYKRTNYNNGNRRHNNNSASDNVSGVNNDNRRRNPNSGNNRANPNTNGSATAAVLAN